MANDLFIGVPQNLEDPETLEFFIIQLITKLSSVLGQDDSVTFDNITARISELESRITDFDDSSTNQFSSLEEQITVLEANFEPRVTSLENTRTTINALTAIPAAPATYDQAALQVIIDRINQIIGA